MQYFLHIIDIIHIFKFSFFLQKILKKHIYRALKISRLKHWRDNFDFDFDFRDFLFKSL